MCRFLAYRGRPILLEAMIASPSHSLIQQSLHAQESRTETNGDGFGIGWYGEHNHPGLYREVHPAWSDDNLRSLCAHVRSHLFFAHVRAATDTATTRANCHPFAAGRFMFMHNGQVGGYKTIRRRMESHIADDIYAGRHGTTDTETLFLIALSLGLADNPVRAISATLRVVVAEMERSGVTAPLRFTAALTDGETIWAFRWASDGEPATLYFQRGDGGTVVVSEPFDDRREAWIRVPSGHALIARQDAAVEIAALNVT